MNLERRVAVLEAHRARPDTCVFCEPGETAEQAIERQGIADSADHEVICIRWQEPEASENSPRGKAAGS